MKLLSVFIVSCCVLQSLGAPRTSRIPCLDRFERVTLDLINNNAFVDEPRYVPECEEDGVAWKPAQCSHEGAGFCFCVDPETGIIKEGTKSSEESKETIQCGEPTEAPAEELSPCLQRQQAYRRIPGVAGITDEYYPVCAEDGSFLAMQRNARTYICVDISDGEVIPGTEYYGSKDPLYLQENVCQAYSDTWHQYLDWLDSSSAVLQASMRGGEHQHWNYFLHENANVILRTFWRFADGEASEEVPNEELDANVNSNQNISPEETDGPATESREEYDSEEFNINLEPTAISNEEEELTPDSTNDIYDYSDYYPFNEEHNNGENTPQQEEGVQEEEVGEQEQNLFEETSRDASNYDDYMNQFEGQFIQEVPEEPTQPTSEIDMEELIRVWNQNPEHHDLTTLLRMLSAEEPEAQGGENESVPEGEISEYPPVEEENRYLSGDNTENNSQFRHLNNEAVPETSAFEDNQTNLNLRKSSR